MSADIPIEDIDAGDDTPKLARASLLRTVEAVNLLYYNMEVPVTGTPGPIIIHRNVAINNDLGSIPQQTQGYGVQLGITHGQLRATLLQQSVDVNDERLYILNNASPPNGAFSSNSFIYDKNAAAATYYMQRAGEHIFATAPIASAVNAAITFTQRLKVAADAVSVLEGKVQITNSVGVNQAFLTGASTSTLSAFSISSIAAADAYIKGSSAGDTAIRSEAGNLVLGTLNGYTVIGTGTTVAARFNNNGSVVIPGPANITSTSATLAVGGGAVIVVGNGQNAVSTAKGFWAYQNPTSAPNTGFGLQINANQGLDMWVGNTSSAFLRALNLQTSGKILMGGVAGATAIGDLHINSIGVDSSGSLSLTGQSNASYLLLGNRDSLGTAGPSIISGVNRSIAFGFGTSFAARDGGTLTTVALIDAATSSVNVGNPTPNASYPLNVNLIGASGLQQNALAIVSPAVTPGNAGAGLGLTWGANFLGMRTIHGGDANTASLGLYTVTGGASALAATLTASKQLNIAGDTIRLGVNSIPVLGADSLQATYLRGTTVQIQNAAATATWALFSASGASIYTDVTMNGLTTIGGTLVVTRQIEATADKAYAATTTYDWNVASVWFTNAPTGNWAAAFTNVPTATSQVMSCTVIVQQGATGYYPASMTINGVAVTIKWAGGVTPIATPNQVDVFNFSLIRTSSGAWIVLGSATPYTS